MDKSLSVHRKESCYKVAECINHEVFLAKKLVLRLQKVCIMMCSSQGKLLLSCGMYISSCLFDKERCFKVV